MKIIIKETGIVETLTLINPASGIDRISDFIGNNPDRHLVWDADQEAYVCNQDTFDWWDAVVTANQSLDYRIHELIREHGSETVYEVIHDAGNEDLEDYAAYANQLLDEAFG
jgi:hypothetical protein